MSAVPALNPELAHHIAALRRAVDGFEPIVTLDARSRALVSSAKALLNRCDDLQEAAEPSAETRPTRRVRIPVHWSPHTQSWAIQAAIEVDPKRPVVDAIAFSPAPVVAVVVVDLPIPAPPTAINASMVEETR